VPLTTADGVYTLLYVLMACFTNPFININTCFCITKVFANTRNSLSLDNDSKYKNTVPGPWAIISCKFEIVNSKYGFLALLCGLSFMHVLSFDQRPLTLALLKSFSMHLCFAFVVILYSCSLILHMHYDLPFDKMPFFLCKSLPISENQLPFC